MIFGVELETAIKQGLALLGLPCDEKVVERLSLYIVELERWNRRVNLTGLRDRDALVKKLLYDSFFLYGFVAGNAVLDMGSGSGIVGIPIAILNGAVKVFSVDKSLRKIQFQRHIKRSLHLEGFEPLHERIEDLEPLGVDTLIAKGFGPIEDILAKGGTHLRRGGRALIPKGHKEEGGDFEGYCLRDTTHYTLPGGERPYRLFIYEKS
jgi:16S rRNA (guanine527-N7)-methyltransferase